MKTQDMKVVDASGPPRERGRMIGESLREEVRALNEIHLDAVNRRPGYSAEGYYTAFRAYSRHRAAVESLAPDLLEEVWGMAEGAGVSREDAFRMQLGDEDWSFDAYHYAPRMQPRDKCTAFAVVESHALTYAGQNMDVMSYVDGYQVVLRIREPEGQSLVFTYAGTIGLCGMNDAPLGVTCNTLMQLGGGPDGLPVAFMVRALLQRRSYEDAERFLRSTGHASGQNYILSEPGRVGSFECSPAKVAEYRSRADGLRVCHTNHPLANDDTASFERLRRDHQGGAWAAGHANSSSRYASIASRTVWRDEPVTLEGLKAALRAQDDPESPVCRDRSGGEGPSVIAFTAGSVIYELSDNPKLHVAGGPPTQSEYVTVGFDR
jgi:hypothetical protein